MSGFSQVSRPSLLVQARIAKALQEIKARGVKDDYCPRCGTFDWSVDLLDILVNSALRRTSIGEFAFSETLMTGGALNVLSVTCKNCGYTMFHTLNILENPKRR